MRKTTSFLLIIFIFLIGSCSKEVIFSEKNDLIKEQLKDKPIVNESPIKKQLENISEMKNNQEIENQSEEKINENDIQPRDSNKVINKINLSIVKEFKVEKMNSLTFDGYNLWGTTSFNTLSKIDIISGEIISNCSLPFDAKGVTFDGKYLWVTVRRTSGQGSDYKIIAEIYKINAEMCSNNIQCNSENECILDSWSIEQSQYPKGVTFDGNHFYILDEHPGLVLKFDLKGRLMESFKAPNEILVRGRARTLAG
ncbi:hypothetical protein J4448_00125 [Candidatus Woesearchaeota archaeon]|nr:hypothetical protein [Candidatus Woesearchaeota archaeon]